jgi:N1-aminopropylagmatine ureohydrolase
LQALSQRCRVVGFDVVELCPGNYNRAPDFLAAKLIYKFLSYRFKEPV